MLISQTEKSSFNYFSSLVSKDFIIKSLMLEESVHQQCSILPSNALLSFILNSMEYSQVKDKGRFSELVNCKMQRYFTEVQLLVVQIDQRFFMITDLNGDDQDDALLHKNFDCSDYFKVDIMVGNFSIAINFSLSYFAYRFKSLVSIQ